MVEFISKYKYPLIFGCLGLFLGILFFTLGFIKTIADSKLTFSID